MNKTVLAFLVATAAGGVSTGLAACSSSSNHGGGSPDAAADTSTTEGGGGGGDSAPDGGGGGFTPTIACSDSIDSVYADPGDVSGKAKGAILKCAHDQDYSATALQALAAAEVDGGTPGYSGKAFTSGAHVYRVLYRTERGDTANSPGYSSALVLLPDTPRASTLPVVIASHGSRGQAGKCAPSKLDPAADDVNPDFIHQVYPLVGAGYAVIAPDLAGYANFGGANNPPSAYADAADVGKSTLDADPALRNVLPAASLSSKTVITGHSQGGHTALAALSLASTYAPSLNIAAVAVYSPLWISQHAWAAIFLEPTNYGFAESSAGVVSLWYHYTHTTLLDGPDSGFPIFDPTKLPVVQSFVANDCWNSSYPDLVEAGASANDFFTSSYVSGIGVAATPLGNGNCNGDTTCTTWIQRMTNDWPHLTGAAAQVPILVWYGNDDTTITPDAMQCVFNRLSGDTASYSVCYDPSPVGHSGVVSADSDYVGDWIAQQALGGPAPSEPCAALTSNGSGVPQLTDDGGAPIACNSLLSNE
ncbi:MAG TPA: alpha/beta fold hydrolase [Polyangiaceae bacterium]|jgi:pimeloyl-ACP methyl ester carboxylesterase